MRYANGLEAPLDFGDGDGETRMCSRCTAAEHIRRDMEAHAAMLDALEEERARAEAEAKLRAAGEAPAAASKAGKGKKKK